MPLFSTCLLDKLSSIYSQLGWQEVRLAGGASSLNRRLDRDLGATVSESLFDRIRNFAQM